MTIKAIETEYNGYKFRSRLEARWAVFFDALGVEYEYEPEGYITFDGNKYLPDFRLTSEDNILVEVKGSDEQLKKDWDKIASAVDFDATPAGNGLLILGQTPNPELIGWGAIPIFNFLKCRKGIDCDYAAFIWKNYGKRTKYLTIGKDEIIKEVYGFSYRVDGSAFGCEMPKCITSQSMMLTRDRLTSYNFEWLKKAYKAARQARFEHGETPVIRHD